MIHQNFPHGNLPVIEGVFRAAAAAAAAAGS
jgi:hypothetical protein